MKLTNQSRFEIVGLAEESNEEILRPSLTYWQDAWMRMRKNKGSMIGLFFITLFILLATFAPMISNYEYDDQNLQVVNLPPKVPWLEKIEFLQLDGIVNEKIDSQGITTPAHDAYVIQSPDTGETVPYDNYHYFGTDDLGRDIWTRVWTGSRVSLTIALIAVIFDVVIGVTYGGISGFFGKRVDIVMQRIVEVLYGIPYLIIVMLFLVIFQKPGILTISLALSITGWIGMSRIVRAQLMKLKSQEFVLASKTLGAANSSLIIKHLIPNTIGPILISVMFTIPSAIFAEAFLSFIGLGINPPMASLGTLVQDGLKYMTTSPYKLFFPAMVISILILSFNLVADGLRDALDPKMRK